MTFSVIIATYNRPYRLEKALSAIGSAIDVSGVMHTIVVVDNGERVSSGKVVSSFVSRTGTDTVCLTSAFGNKPLALNTAIRAAKTEWLAFTDDDTLPDKNWFVEAEHYIDANPQVKIFGGKIVPGDSNDQLPRWLRSSEAQILLRGPAIVSYEPLTESGFLNEKSQVPLGANIFVHKSIFEKYGGYDEKLWERCGKAALGCEDAEFAIRVRNGGEMIGYCADAVVIHPVESSRATIIFHLKWAWRAGVREGILFQENKSFLGNIRLFYSSMRSALVGLCCAVFGKVPVAVKFGMASAWALGEWKQRFLMLRRSNLWESKLFLWLCAWAGMRPLTRGILSDFVAWYYWNVSEWQLSSFYGASYLDGYAANMKEETSIKRAQAQAIRQVLPGLKKLLVVGCSNGLLVKELVDLGMDTYGVDVSPDIFKHAVAGVSDRLRLGSITKIPFSEDNGFDVVVAIDVVEHVPAGQIEMMVSELRRINVEYLVLVINHTALSCLGHVTMKPLSWWQHQFSPHYVLASELSVDYEKVPSVYSLVQGGDPSFTFWRRKHGHN